MSDVHPTALLTVEVAYAEPDRQEILTVNVPQGATALEAVKLSLIETRFPSLDVERSDMGIFSKLIGSPATYQVADGDRIEIYRPLQIDPKQARLNRARKKERDSDED